MRLAVCQMLSGDDPVENLREVERLTREAAAAGADLAVFPEYAMFDEAALSERFVERAEGLDGPFASGLVALAAETGVTVVAGMLERVEGDRPGEPGRANGAGAEEAPSAERAFNTLVAVAPDRGIVATYRKAHLYDAFGFKESDFLRAGDLAGPVTFEAAGATVGMLTCYDLRFPEAARQHADAGTELLLYPAAWIPGPRKEDHWNTLARARAIENTLYVAAVSQAPRMGVGGSLVADPMGVTVCELGEQVGMAVAEVDPARVAEVRRSNPSLANRRFRVAPA